MTTQGARESLREARLQRRWTQRFVAEQLQSLAHYKHMDMSAAVNADMVSKWERGEKGISPYYRELLCLLFETNTNSLGLDGRPAERSCNEPPEPDSTEPKIADLVSEAAALIEQLGTGGQLLRSRIAEAWMNEALRRRTLIKLVGLSAVSPVVSRISNAGTHVPEVTVQQFDELADRYQSLYHSTRPSALIHPVLAHLDAIAELVKDHTGSTTRSHISANRSRVALLAGRISFFDFNDLMSARGYYNLSIEAATEAGDLHQVAAAMGHLAFVPAAENSFSTGIEYLDSAKSRISMSPHGPLLSWLYAVESELHSRNGDNVAALRAVSYARDAHSDPSEFIDLPWFDYFDRNRLAGFSGYALLRAGRYAEAASELTSALDLPASAVKQRSVFLADLATVYFYSGDLDHACEIAVSAADELDRAGYATGVDRLREFYDLVSPHRSARSVQEFSERLVALRVREV